MARQKERAQCTSLTTSGEKCRRSPVPGLTVCAVHGGGTAAAVRSGRRRVVGQAAQRLWGIAPDGSSLSVEEELTRLARNKIADIIALRTKISEDEVGHHIGRLTESMTDVEYDIEGTVQSKAGTQSTRVRRAGTSVWVQELHRAEMELVQILRLLQEVTGSTEGTDTKRLQMQAAREAARLSKAFPGLAVDQIASEIVKKAS